VELVFEICKIVLVVVSAFLVGLFFFLLRRGVDALEDIAKHLKGIERELGKQTEIEQRQENRRRFSE